jgi:peroxin-10
LGLIQTEKRKLGVPSAIRSWLFVFFQVFGAYWSEKVLQKVQKGVINSQIASEDKSRLEKLISFLRTACEGLNRIHLALFYTFGTYYHLGKRLTGVKYLSIRSESSQEILKYFRYLGYFTVIQTFIAAGIWIWSLTALDSKSKETSEKILSSSFSWQNSRNFKCLICLEFGRPLASTFCGHVFCWNCLQGIQSCPICRSSVAPNQIVPLMNF